MAPEEFHKIRKAAGLTQSQMAARLGVTRLTICNWEGTKFRIPDDVLDRLAEKGLEAKTPKPNKSNVALIRATVDAYRGMRRQPMPVGCHAYIVTMWHERGFTPCREAMAAIAAEFPDILET